MRWMSWGCEWEKVFQNLILYVYSLSPGLWSARILWSWAFAWSTSCEGRRVVVELFRSTNRRFILKLFLYLWWQDRIHYGIDVTDTRQDTRIATHHKYKQNQALKAHVCIVMWWGRHFIFFFKVSFEKHPIEHGWLVLIGSIIMQSIRSMIWWL